MGWTKPEVAEQLEQLLDKQGLIGLCQMLAEICSLKADHIRDNWQDEPLAKAWGRAASQLALTAKRLPVV